MMAGKAGATSLTAVEAFQPMAACASQVTKANGYKAPFFFLFPLPMNEGRVKQVRIFDQRSTDEDLEMKMEPKPNLCVAEVFDSELIGEGALRTFQDALRRHLSVHSLSQSSDRDFKVIFLKPGARVIPSRAQIRVVGIESSFLTRWDRLPAQVCVEGTSVKVPPSHTECPGSTFQYSSFKINNLSSILKATSASMTFNWTPYQREASRHSRSPSQLSSLTPSRSHNFPL